MARQMAAPLATPAGGLDLQMATASPTKGSSQNDVRIIPASSKGSNFEELVANQACSDARHLMDAEISHPGEGNSTEASGTNHKCSKEDNLGVVECESSNSSKETAASALCSDENSSKQVADTQFRSMKDTSIDAMEPCSKDNNAKVVESCPSCSIEKISTEAEACPSCSKECNSEGTGARPSCSDTRAKSTAHEPRAGKDRASGLPPRPGGTPRLSSLASSFQFRSSSDLLQSRRLSSPDQRPCKATTTSPRLPLRTRLRREPSAQGKELLQKSHSDPSTRQRRPLLLHRRRGSPVSKCILTLDGYSYVIVASPPDKGAVTSPREEPQQQPVLNRNGQLNKQGSLTILRRSSSRTLGRARVPGDPDGGDADEAAEKAAVRLKALLRRLKQEDVPAILFQQDLQFAIEVLESCYVEDAKRHADEEDELSEVEPDAVPPEVREWLASTFTRQLSGGRRKNDEKPKFRSVANAIRAGIFVERIYRRLCSATFLQLPPEVSKVLKRVDCWDFDVFVLQETSNNTPLRCLSYELLNRYGLLHKFKVPPSSLEAFLQQMEAGYNKFKNPYHNNVHAADVLQTMHYMLSQTGLMNWLTDIEILATLVAAMIHDYEHTGTTNNFHVMSGSDTALLYNDRAVLENHHISAAFRLLQEEGNNLLVNLSREEYREFRGLVIEMVLATDMSSHFQQIKAMKSMLLSDASLDKSKALSLVLHCCDISHPSKDWSVHLRWTSQLLEEFFRQGDREHELGLPYSPLCDRKNTLVAESQIGFIDFIVDPSMSVCSDLLDRVASISSNSTVSNSIAEEPSIEPGGPIRRPMRGGAEVKRPWVACLGVNKGNWKERAARDAELRQQQEEEESQLAASGQHNPDAAPQPSCRQSNGGAS